MKSLIVLLIGLFTLPGIIQSQDFPFPEKDALWHGVWTRSQGGNGTTWFWQEYFNGDTLVDGKEYGMIFLKKTCGYSTFHNPNTGESGISYFSNKDSLNDIAVGGIREEDNRVYFYKFNYDQNVHGQFPTHGFAIQNLEVNQEYLLYDFNYVAGDTVSYPGGTIAVFKDISGFLGDRKIFRLRYSSNNNSHPDYFDYWIEGSGSTGGLFAPYSSLLTGPPSDYPEDFTCAFQNGELIAGEWECDACGNVVGTTNLTPPTAILIKPNPSSDFITIEHPFEKSLAFEIRNALGQLLQKGTYHQKQTLDLTAYPAGLYYLILPSQGIVERVMKY